MSLSEKDIIFIKGFTAIAQAEFWTSYTAPTDDSWSWEWETATEEERSQIEQDAATSHEIGARVYGQLLGSCLLDDRIDGFSRHLIESSISDITYRGLYYGHELAKGILEATNNG